MIMNKEMNGGDGCGLTRTRYGCGPYHVVSLSSMSFLSLFLSLLLSLLLSLFLSLFLFRLSCGHDSNLTFPFSMPSISRESLTTGRAVCSISCFRASQRILPQSLSIPKILERNLERWPYSWTPHSEEYPAKKANLC